MKKKRETCKYCGEKMDAKTTRQEFCSDKCRVYWNRDQNINYPKAEEIDVKNTDWGKPVASKTIEISRNVLWLGNDNKLTPELIQAKIDEYEAEIGTLGKGQWADIRKNGLQKKIAELKKQLK